MGKALMERGDGIISHRLFFLGQTIFFLDRAEGEKIKCKRFHKKQM